MDVDKPKETTESKEQVERAYFEKLNNILKVGRELARRRNVRFTTEAYVLNSANSYLIKNMRNMFPGMLSDSGDWKTQIAVDFLLSFTNAYAPYISNSVDRLFSVAIQLSSKSKREWGEDLSAVSSTIKTKILGVIEIAQNVCKTLIELSRRGREIYDESDSVGIAVKRIAKETADILGALKTNVKGEAVKFYREMSLQADILYRQLFKDLPTTLKTIGNFAKESYALKAFSSVMFVRYVSDVIAPLVNSVANLLIDKTVNPVANGIFGIIGSSALSTVSYVAWYFYSSTVTDAISETVLMSVANTKYFESYRDQLLKDSLNSTLYSRMNIRESYGKYGPEAQMIVLNKLSIMSRVVPLTISTLSQNILKNASEIVETLRRLSLPTSVLTLRDVEMIKDRKEEIKSEMARLSSEDAERFQTMDRLFTIVDNISTFVEGRRTITRQDLSRLLPKTEIDFVQKFSQWSYYTNPMPSRIAQERPSIKNVFILVIQQDGANLSKNPSGGLVFTKPKATSVPSAFGIYQNESIKTEATQNGNADHLLSLWYDTARADLYEQFTSADNEWARTLLYKNHVYSIDLWGRDFLQGKNFPWIKSFTKTPLTPSKGELQIYFENVFRANVQDSSYIDERTFSEEDLQRQFQFLNELCQHHTFLEAVANFANTTLAMRERDNYNNAIVPHYFVQIIGFGGEDFSLHGSQMYEKFQDWLLGGTGGNGSKTSPLLSANTFQNKNKFGCYLSQQYNILSSYASQDGASEDEYLSWINLSQSLAECNVFSTPEPIYSRMLQEQNGRGEKVVKNLMTRVDFSTAFDIEVYCRSIHRVLENETGEFFGAQRENNDIVNLKSNHDSIVIEEFIAFSKQEEKMKGDMMDEDEKLLTFSKMRLMRKNYYTHHIVDAKSLENANAVYRQKLTEIQTMINRSILLQRSLSESQQDGNDSIKIELNSLLFPIRSNILSDSSLAQLLYDTLSLHNVQDLQGLFRDAQRVLKLDIIALGEKITELDAKINTIQTDVYALRPEYGTNLKQFKAFQTQFSLPLQKDLEKIEEDKINSDTLLGATFTLLNTVRQEGRKDSKIQKSQTYLKLESDLSTLAEKIMKLKDSEETLSDQLKSIKENLYNSKLIFYREIGELVRNNISVPNINPEYYLFDYDNSESLPKDENIYAMIKHALDCNILFSVYVNTIMTRLYVDSSNIPESIQVLPSVAAFDTSGWMNEDDKVMANLSPKQAQQVWTSSSTGNINDIFLKWNLHFTRLAKDLVSSSSLLKKTTGPTRINASRFWISPKKSLFDVETRTILERISLEHVHRFDANEFSWSSASPLDEGDSTILKDISDTFKPNQSITENVTSFAERLLPRLRHGNTDLTSNNPLHSGGLNDYIRRGRFTILWSNALSGKNNVSLNDGRNDQLSVAEIALAIDALKRDKAFIDRYAITPGDLNALYSKISLLQQDFDKRLGATMIAQTAPQVLSTSTEHDSWPNVFDSNYAIKSIFSTIDDEDFLPDSKDPELLLKRFQRGEGLKTTIALLDSTINPLRPVQDLIGKSVTPRTARERLGVIVENIKRLQLNIYKTEYENAVNFLQKLSLRDKVLPLGVDSKTSQQYKLDLNISCIVDLRDTRFLPQKAIVELRRSAEIYMKMREMDKELGRFEIDVKANVKSNMRELSYELVNVVGGGTKSSTPNLRLFVAGGYWKKASKFLPSSAMCLFGYNRLQLEITKNLLKSEMLKVLLPWQTIAWSLLFDRIDNWVSNLFLSNTATSSQQQQPLSKSNPSANTCILKDVAVDRLVPTYGTVAIREYVGTVHLKALEPLSRKLQRPRKMDDKLTKERPTSPTDPLSDIAQKIKVLLEIKNVQSLSETEILRELNLTLEDVSTFEEEKQRLVQSNGGQPMSLFDLVGALRDASAGLAYLHLRRQVHDNITTDSIYLDDDSRAYIGDYGGLFDRESDAYQKVAQSQLSGDDSNKTSKDVRDFGRMITTLIDQSFDYGFGGQDNPSFTTPSKVGTQYNERILSKMNPVDRILHRLSPFTLNSDLFEKGEDDGRDYEIPKNRYRLTTGVASKIVQSLREVGKNAMMNTEDGTYNPLQLFLNLHEIYGYMNLAIEPIMMSDAPFDSSIVNPGTWLPRLSSKLSREGDFVNPEIFLTPIMVGMTALKYADILPTLTVLPESVVPVATLLTLAPFVLKWFQVMMAELDGDDLVGVSKDVNIVLEPDTFKSVESTKLIYEAIETSSLSGSRPTYGSEIGRLKPVGQETTSDSSLTTLRVQDRVVVKRMDEFFSPPTPDQPTQTFANTTLMNDWERTSNLVDGIQEQSLPRSTSLNNVEAPGGVLAIDVANQAIAAGVFSFIFGALRPFVRAGGAIVQQVAGGQQQQQIPLFMMGNLAALGAAANIALQGGGAQLAQAIAGRQLARMRP